MKKAVDKLILRAYNVAMVSKVMMQIEIILLSLKGLCFIPIEANRK